MSLLIHRDCRPHSAALAHGTFVSVFGRGEPPDRLSAQVATPRPRWCASPRLAGKPWTVLIHHRSATKRTGLGSPAKPGELTFRRLTPVSERLPGFLTWLFVRYFLEFTGPMRYKNVYGGPRSSDPGRPLNGGFAAQGEAGIRRRCGSILIRDILFESSAMRLRARIGERR